ncbi:MAG TPA: DUF3536 domain-containing protein [Gemmatimonadales bacterium]
MPPPRSVVVHGHFYQPPRSDPWFEEMPRECSAAPFHDWNERIERECYRAVVAARVLDGTGRIASVVNTLTSISFDFGSTLLAWLERAAPETYAAVLAADRASCERLDGHGNAIAMPYHHVILPLCARRDKETEVRWGIADFARRYGRPPEGMWLPETAVDDETMDVLAAEGLGFTVLAPHQVVGAEPGEPATYRTTAGRTIAVIVYDGPLSHDVAFGPLIRDADLWRQRLLQQSAGRLTALATDGETYGHHHAFGEMALAALLSGLAESTDVRVENFASFLARHPPERVIGLNAPSSWSCPHGVDRWRADCGCRTHPERHTRQQWRVVLREALEWLVEELHGVFERESAGVLRDPWATRDAYGVARMAGDDAVRVLLSSCITTADRHVGTRMAELLDMEWNALSMFTSCGWFFDDIAGIESTQVLRYAVRAIELAGSRREELEAGLTTRLAEAVSNDPALGTGRDIYERDARPAVPAAVRVAALCGVADHLDVVVQPILPDGHEARVQRDVATVVETRTGREQRLQVAVDAPRPADIHITVQRLDGSASWQLAWSQLPERGRVALADILCGTMMPRLLDDRQREAVCRGRDVQRVVRDAVVEAVGALATDDSAAAALRVLELADLCVLLDRPVPFGAQTRFADLTRTLPPERVAALRPVALRLGFA